MPGKYTLERQAQAIEIAALTSQEEAERQTGIPQQTVSRWMAAVPDQVANLMAERRAAIVDNLLASVEAATQALRKGLEAVAAGEPVTSARDLQHLATAGGIAQDKLAAIQGGSGTSRFGDNQATDPRLRDIGERILARLDGDADAQGRGRS